MPVYIIPQPFTSYQKMFRNWPDLVNGYTIQKLSLLLQEIGLSGERSTKSDFEVYTWYLVFKLRNRLWWRRDMVSGLAQNTTSVPWYISMYFVRSFLTFN